VAAAATVSASLAIVLFWLPVLLTGRSIAPDGAIGFIALPVPLAIAVAILRDHLFDIDAALNRTLVYGALTAGVLAVYVTAAAALGSLLGTGNGFGASLLATGAAALAALPLRDALQRAVSRLLYGRRREPLVAMRQLGRQLAWAGDPEAALPAIAATVREVLRVPYARVEMERGGDAGVIAAETGTRPADPVVVPLLHGAAPVGRLVVGRRSGERDFHPDERQLLDDLARQAGTAVAALALKDALARSAERTVLAREEERRRLRRDLHDGLGPALAAIGMRAEAAAVQLPPGAESAQASLEALGEDVRTAIADVRRLVEGLRPPALDELGLVAAIGQQAGRLAGDPGGGTGPRIHVDGPPPGSMPELAAAVEVAAYRITVEALTNVVRHARAASCEVRIRPAGGSLEVEVCDDGIGLPDVPRSGVGLESMRVRAAEVGGDLVVERREPAGTRVLATLPVWPAGVSGLPA
jgi:signal transduction histidine kinase